MPADIGRLTARQIKLLYAECQRAELRERADRIEDTAMGFSGGKDVTEFIRKAREQ